MASLTVPATWDPSASRRRPHTLLASGAEVLGRGPEAARGGRRHAQGPSTRQVIIVAEKKR